MKFSRDAMPLNPSYVIIISGSPVLVRSFWPPHTGGFINLRHLVGLLWTSYQPIAKASTYTGQHITDKDKYPYLQRDSSPRSQWLWGQDLRLRPGGYRDQHPCYVVCLTPRKPARQTCSGVQSVVRSLRSVMNTKNKRLNLCNFTCCFVSVLNAASVIKGRANIGYLWQENSRWNMWT
jgi:hypothetical protein